MKIKTLKWGYDGGGMGCCGPVEGSSLVEITFIDDSGKVLFAYESTNGEGTDMRISDMPLYDLMIQLSDDDIDFENMLEKRNAHTVAEFGMIWGDEIPEEMYESDFSDVLMIALAALNHYFNTPIDEEVEPEEYLGEFVDDDGKIINVPEIVFDDDEYDEDEE